MKKNIIWLFMIVVAALSLASCNSIGGVPAPSGKAALLVHSDFPVGDTQDVFIRFDFFDQNGKTVFSFVPNTSYAIFKNCLPGKVTLKGYGAYNMTRYGYSWKQNVDITLDLKADAVTIFPLKGIAAMISDNYIRAYVDAMKDDDKQACIDYLKKQKNIDGWKIYYANEEID